MTTTQQIVVALFLAGMCICAAAPVCTVKPSGNAKADSALCLHNDAMALADAGKTVEAETHYQEAIGIWKDLGPTFNAHRCVTMAQLGSLYQLEGQWGRVIPMLEEATALCVGSLGDKQPITSGVQVRLAVAYVATGQEPKATPILDKALAPDSGLNESDRALATNALGSYYSLAGDYERGLDYMRKAERSMAAGGDNDPAYGAILCNLAAIYIVTGDTARAGPLLRRTRAIYERTLGPGHPRYASLLLQEGGLALADHKYTEAEKSLREGVEIAERVLPAGSNELAAHQVTFGLALLKNGKLDEADRMLTPALEAKRAVYRKPHRELAVTLQAVANLRAAQGKNDEAGRLYGESVQVWEQALGPANPELRTALTEYAHFARSVREADLVRALERRAKSIHSFQ